jgi:hypothetical protein
MLLLSTPASTLPIQATLIRMPDNTINIVVDCYAGYRGEETPRTFVLGDRRVEVEQVIDRWLAPNHRYFKVTGSDGHTYILRHDPMQIVGS